MLWSRLSDVCMTAGVLNTTFVSEMMRLSVAPSHVNIHNFSSSRTRGSPFFSSLIATCKCSRSGGGGGIKKRKKGSGENNKTSGMTACVKGQDIDGP